MNKLTVILAAASIISGVSAAAAKAPKRGISENEIRFKAELALLNQHCSWFYNWGNEFGNTYLGSTPGMEFVPMCWNAAYSADKIRNYVASHPETKYLLGFNEPNFSNQANMTPAAAAAAWPQVRALADELGLKLVAPAMNYSPNPPYQSPTQWFDEFVALVGDDAFDYVAVHSYGGLGNIVELATTFHERYGKEVWLTEFCYWPGEDPNTYIAPETQIASMIQSVEWLEKTPWIFRYAWFKAIGESESNAAPNFALVAKGTKENERFLSEQGKVYFNLPVFDADEYNPVGEWIPSKNFISQKGTLLGTNTDAAIDAAIEVARFNSGSWIDYQFDVPASGTYYLTLRVAGQGEPVRFDPQIAIYSVDENSEPCDELAPVRTIQLSGDDNVYTEESFRIDLKQGKQVIRIADAVPASPSGMRFSAVRLSDSAAIRFIAAGEIDGEAAVYDLQGRRMPSADNLPRGVYVAGGRKIYIK